MRFGVYIATSLLVLGCTKAPQTVQRSSYNCDSNPEDCNGGFNPETNGASLDFTVPESVAKDKDFDISWGAVPGVEKYDLIIGKDEKCTEVVFALKDQTVRSQKISMTTVGTFYACLNAKAGNGSVVARKEGYKFVVTSTSSASETEFAAAKNLIISADSASGTNHSATDDDTTIYFIWTAAADSTNGIKDYSIEIYTGASCGGSLVKFNGVTTTTYTYAAAAYNSTYSFRVIATNNKLETKTSECSQSTAISYPVFNINFDSAVDYTYDNTVLSISGGVASLLAVTQTYDGNVVGEFLAPKAHNNTTWDTDHLELKNAGSPDPRAMPNNFYHGVDASNLKVLFHFDDPWVQNSDTVYDAMGINGTFSSSSSGVNRSVKGKHGRALNLNAASLDHVNAGTGIGDLTGELTAIFWVKVSDVTWDNSLLAQQDGTALNFKLTVGAPTDGKFSLWWNSPSTGFRLTSNTSIQANEWTQVVAVRSGSSGNWTGRIFVNGSLDTSDTTALNPNSLAGQDLLIGDGSPYDCHCTIDEVAVFDRALSATEIATLYNNQVKNFTHEQWTEVPGLMDGNVLLLHMEESSGALVDHSAFNHSNTVTGTNLYSRTGQIGNAVRTDGSFDFGDKAEFKFTTEMTASVWVKADTGSNAYIYDRYGGTTPDRVYRLQVDWGQVNFYTFTGVSSNANDTINTGPGVVDDGNWHHVVAVLRAGTKYLYVNGKVAASGAWAHTIGAANGTPLQVGRSFNGEIDELALWNRGLSHQEVQMLYDLQKGSFRGNVHEFPNDQSATVDDWFPMNGNVLLMHMNETSVVDSGTNPTIYDYSGGGNSAGFNANDDASENSTTGRLGRGLVFDGTDDYIPLGTPSNLQVANVTVSLWFKTTNPGGVLYQYAVTCFAQGYHFKLNTNEYPVFQINNGATNYSASVAYNVADNKWHHAVGSYDGSTVKLYLDGQLVGTNSISTTIAYTSWPCEIGRNPGGQNHYWAGSLDEVAIWNRALSDDEVSKIYDYQAAKYSGTFISDVLDTGSTSAQWQTLGWNMIRPYGKALGTNDLSSSYSALPNDTLMSGNILLMHLDETAVDGVGASRDIQDFSPSGNHGDTHASMTADLRYGKPGIFGTALRFDGTDDHVDVDGTSYPATTAARTLCAWARLENGSGADIIASYGTQSTDNQNFGMMAQTGTWWFFAHGATNDYDTGVSTDREWHHHCVTYDGTDAIYYLDSAQIGSQSRTLATTGGDFTIGSMNGNNHYFDGWIDEVALWSRALSLGEVQELYKRGASRIRFQVRSCDASGCDDEPWVTPDSSMSPYSSYGEMFSELHNTTTSNPSLTFGGFGSHSVSNNQFFQWKAYLDTMDTAQIPELQSVTVGPTHYYGGNPSVVTSASLSFSSLVSFTETSSAGVVKYQLSNDGGTTWYYYNSGWTTTTGGYAQSSSASDINTDIGSFPVGSGSLKVKAFLNSAASAVATSLDNVAIQYTP